MNIYYGIFTFEIEIYEIRCGRSRISIGKLYLTLKYLFIYFCCYLDVSD